MKHSNLVIMKCTDSYHLISDGQKGERYQLKIYILLLQNAIHFMTKRDKANRKWNNSFLISK